jgi:hypothetical protein
VAWAIFLYRGDTVFGIRDQFPKDNLDFGAHCKTKRRAQPNDAVA